MASKSHKIIVNLVLIVSILNVVNGASLSLDEQKKYRHLIEGQGLYKQDDDIEIYTANNFKTIYGQKRGLLIEFYNSWCGFCQRFAPSWKALGTDVREWKDIVGIGAVDCSDEDNSPICREFEIMGYPTLRYFHEDYKSGPKMIGVDVPKGEDMNKLRQNLVQRLLTEQKEGRGIARHHLLSYDEPNVDKVFHNLTDNVKYVFLVVEETNNLAATTSLDLHKISDIRIMSVVKENEIFIKNEHISNFPTIIVVDRDLLSRHLKTAGNSREDILLSIKTYLTTKGIIVPTPQPKDKNVGIWMNNPVPKMSALLEAREQNALFQKVKKMGDVVFQMDLETALRTALKNEVATTKVIEGEKLEALKNFLDVIIKYFPLGGNGKVFMEGLRKKINKTSVNGAEIQAYLHPSENEDEGIFSSPQKWLGCAGSNPNRRKYPCGLWKMFHYLTVSAAEQNAKNPDANPLEVLNAMLGYIKNFFGCADCSKHFQEMAVKNDMKSVSELNSSVIWLWIAHNEVNKRLAGDATEDPEYPKIQFPSKESCPKCKDGDKWNLHEVFQFLKHMYSNVNIRYLGADTKVLHEGLGTIRNKRSLGAWEIINRMDVSMCFILYIVCFGLLVLIIRQFLKKGYKKKMYVHDILGKV